MRPRSPKEVPREATHTLPAGTLATDVSDTSVDVPSIIGEAQYRSVIDLLPQAVWIAGPEGTVIYCNQYWCEFSGLSLAQTAENGWVSILHPEDRPRAFASWRRAIAAGTPNQGEYRFRRARDGEYRWHLTQGVPMKDAGGRVMQRIGIAIDIHAQKANEIALRERDEQLHLAIEAARLGTWDYVLEGRRFSTSYRAKAMFGSPPDVELTYEGYLAIVHPEDRGLVREAYGRATSPNGLSEFEIHYRIMRPDSAVRWIAARGKGVFSGAGSQRKPVRLTGTVQDITDKKLADQALRESEAKFRALIENSSDAIMLLDSGSRVMYASAGAQRILGYPLDDLIGINGFELCHPESHAAVRQQMEECLRKPGQPVAGSARIRHKDGTWRVVEGVLTNLLHDPHVRGIVNNYRDITEKVQAEQALRDSEEKFRRAFRSNPDAMTITTLADGVYLDVNDAFLRLTAFTRQDVVGRKSLDVGSWVETEDRSRMVQALMANGRLESMDTCFRKKTGEVLFVHLSAELIEIGNVQCVLATSQDITERKLAAEELRRSEEQYRSLIERAPYGICRITAQGRFLLVNPALVTMLGYESASELMALNVTTQVYEVPEERTRVTLHMEQEPEQQPVEARWKRKDGRTIAVRLAGRPVHDSQGRLLHSEVIVELVSRQ
ncbi:MAG: PAS domain S-box protein [Acidobacteriia bacterium]|nr:PAS domain S-box protein [Terriglobia bacterium]